MQRFRVCKKLIRAFALALTGVALALGVPGPPVLAAVKHPLDALEKAEYAKVAEILKAEKRIDDKSRFALVTLKEPDKASVLEWQAGQAIPRAAFVIVKQGKSTFEGVVDLTGGKVASWVERKGVQAGVLFEEFFGAQGIVVKDPRWQAAMRKRGYTEFPKDRFFCAPLTAGYLGLRENRGYRILNVQCFDEKGMTTNMFGKPIEGITAVVDLNAAKVLRVVDTGVVPVSGDSHNYDQKAVGGLQPPMKPVLITQPKGVNYSIDGAMVKWRNWSFHLRFDRRVGTVISVARFADGGRERSVLYQGSLSEVFVPYMDPSYGWRFKSYMDAGEYGFGLLASTLKAGADCPGNATFVSGIVAFDDGKPNDYKDVVCIFERNTGDPAWRHAEILNKTHETRARVDLVVRMIATVGNYDYKVDWIFNQIGAIQVEVGATGIDIAKGVHSHSMSDPTAQKDTRYGALVAPNLVTPYHDHFFSFRLDFDVDGPNNSFVRDIMRTRRLSKANARRSLWQVVSRTAKREREAILDVDLKKPEQWRIVSATARNAVGNPTGYVLAPASIITSLLRSDDWLQKRAGFAAHHLWVTPYNPDEIYAAGTYPNQSRGRDGLHVWTRKNRRIENTDIVLWYTLGFRHVTSAEDWPVLPMVYETGSFLIRPFNFFDRNPIINLPAQLMVEKPAGSKKAVKPDAKKKGAK